MMGMIARRLLQLPLVLLVIYTLTLTLAWQIPGSPLEKGEGRRPPAEVEQEMKRQYRLDSFWSFYWSYLGNATGWNYAVDSLGGPAIAATGTSDAEAGVRPALRVFDLGPSLRNEDWRCNEIIAGSLPVSVAVGAAAMVIALMLGVGAGVIGAMKPGSVWDVLTLGVALIGVSMPSFVVGTAVLTLFGVILPIAPAGVFSWKSGLLAAFTLSLPFAAYIARLTRMGMTEALGSDYIRTARAKGLSETRVMLKHALKNALLPVVSYTGPACAMAMTGSFVVERVFNIPGMGQHFVDAVLNKDLFLIIAVVMVFSTMLIVLNLAVDVLYRWIDPRIGRS